MKHDIKDGKKRIYGLNNSGSTLVTVIVVVAFMSILATTVLYLAGENYKTKIYDLKTKESFYEAEEIVEVFKASLIRDVAECSKPAYDAVVTNYAQSGDKDARATEYLSQFKIQFDSKIQEKLSVTVDEETNPNPGITVDSVVDAFIPFAEEVTGSSYAKYKININGNDLYFDVELPDSYKDLYTSPQKDELFDTTNHNAESYIINDIRIKVWDEKTHYYSEISTSFMITPPKLNWGEDVDNENKDIDFSECVRFLNYVKE